jgi:hypothetical protein
MGAFVFAGIAFGLVLVDAFQFFWGEFLAFGAVYFGGDSGLAGHVLGAGFHDPGNGFSL